MATDDLRKIWPEESYTKENEAGLITRWESACLTGVQTWVRVPAMVGRWQCVSLKGCKQHVPEVVSQTRSPSTVRSTSLTT